MLYTSPGTMLASPYNLGSPICLSGSAQEATCRQVPQGNLMFLAVLWIRALGDQSTDPSVILTCAMRSADDPSASSSTGTSAVGATPTHSNPSTLLSQEKENTAFPNQ